MKIKNIIIIFILLIMGVSIFLLLDALPHIIKSNNIKDNENLEIECIEEGDAKGIDKTFKAKIDNSIKSVNIEIWQKDNEQWTEIDKTNYKISDLKDKENEINIILKMLDNNLQLGYEKDGVGTIKNYPINIDFTSLSVGQGFLSKEKIELNKQLILFKKYGHNNQGQDEYEISFNIDEDFKKSKWDKGLVITVTFLGK